MSEQMGSDFCLKSLCRWRKEDASECFFFGKLFFLSLNAESTWLRQLSKDLKASVRCEKLDLSA